jgi:hypothetical protein
LISPFTVPELLEPDAIYEIRLDLWATANSFSFARFPNLSALT